MSQAKWSFGDKVVHAGRPEWGIGTVSAAHSDTHEGRPCQRLSIRFERAGLKTLSTAFADLRAPGEPVRILEGKGGGGSGGSGGANGSLAGEDAGWLDKLSAQSPEEVLGRLPEDATDPFRSTLQRFETTLKLYRYTPTGASLLDWASVQSGLSDPLSRFSRHELEELFRRYANNRDEHARKLAAELLKSDPAGLGRAVKSAPAGAQQVLKRVTAGR